MVSSRAAALVMDSKGSMSCRIIMAYMLPDIGPSGGGFSTGGLMAESPAMAASSPRAARHTTPGTSSTRPQRERFIWWKTELKKSL
ncbi:MAG: hypothetical protein BWY59_00101 [Verrucomicrobia bacterium ADurb.Bin345]|nr:MAG: hypothetical protein BWY59_00101 [Verrucomicrobia bacterium ADurb.Bin345]